MRTAFLEAMSCTAATVCIVTTDGPAGRAGVTVSSFAPVSADTPQPSVLVCIHHLSMACPRILENGVFCVNVLRHDQSRLADIFAGRVGPVRMGDRFTCAEWTSGRTGSPQARDILAGFDCRLVRNVRVGTHHVVFGAVEDVVIADDGPPLIYANRNYGRPKLALTG